MIQPRSCDHGRDVSITHLSCGTMGGGEILSPISLSMPEVGGRAGPEVIRTIELCLPFISCSTWENSPCPKSGQHSRSGPNCVGMGNQILKT